MELTLSRTSGHVDGVSPSPGASLAPTAPVDVNTYEVNGLYEFGEGRMRGYMGLGMGAMTLHPFIPGVATKPDTRVVANVAVGGKLYLTERLALRVDGRYRWRSASPDTGTVVCGSLGCYALSTDLYSSSEVTAGLSYRFGSERLRDLPPPPKSPGSTAVLASPSRRPEPPERFFAAAGGIALLEVLPWAFSRYVTKEDWAYISTKTVKENFKTGFVFDGDDFDMNQSMHPLHGSLYFNAARSNGYSYWESGAFTMAGSLIWECCLENTAPSINDLVNTTLGGMSRGEMMHRIGVMLRDNGASGFDRFWRELSGAIVDPMGGFNRLVRGEMGRDFPNPDERFPSRFSFVADAGYRHIAAEGVNVGEGIVFPLASIQTTDTLNPETGRSYDFAPGGGFRVAARLYRKEWEIVRLGYGVAYAHTANGSSTSNTLQFFRASGRLPLGRSMGLGAGYSWYSRRTTYPAFYEPTQTQSEWRVFASLSL